MSWDAIKKARGRLSREQGTVIKDWGGRLPVAIIYPNSYYIGMSSLGVHAVYSLLNGHGNVVCERAFWERDDRGVLSLESQRPLADFAVLTFSVTYELDYFNVAKVLKASGIPVFAARRDERHPLVIAGGPCVMANPMPLAPFFDCLCIGEAEVMLPAMLPLLAGGGGREATLEALAALPGIYVPRVRSNGPVVRQWARDLDDFPVGSVVLTRDTELGDLYLMEVGRGCEFGCRFCLVSCAFRPMRFRSLDSLIAQAGKAERRRVGLVGPVVSAHPRIEELLGGLRRMGKGLSISSMRIKPLSGGVLRALAEGGSRTITLAPEAGSERLRRLIKKGISEDDILEAVGKVAGEGIEQLKLYFMVGLPRETDEDTREMIALVLRCKSILDRSGCRLSLNIAPFIPKAGTPFQWLPMAPLAVLNRRLSLIKNSLGPVGIKVKSESIAWSEVQAILSRGDGSLAAVLADTDEVSLAGWRKAAGDLDVDYFAHQMWDTARPLPWGAIDSGTGPGVLKAELARALAPL